MMFAPASTIHTDENDSKWKANGAPLKELKPGTLVKVVEPIGAQGFPEHAA
jgi:hypothetical protein